MLHQPVFGCPADAVGVHRLKGVRLAGAAGAGLDLHERHGPPALGNQVDFADRGAEAAGQDPVELEAEQQRRQGLAALAAALGFDASIAGP